MAGLNDAPRPHDLLTLDSPESLVVESPPPWLGEDSAFLSMVVVRRPPVSGSLIPVGLRGRSRDRRLAGHLPLASIARIITPEALAREAVWRTAHRRDDLPHFAILDDIAYLFDRAGLAWGPTGSLGYELASSLPCLTETSDIDLVAQAPVAPTRALVLDLHDALRRLPVRIDTQIETPPGAVSLTEYASGAQRIALRTPFGPRLVVDPWREGS
jgi:phosphoribosyl-dephospho-CoA transferase